MHNSQILIIVAVIAFAGLRLYQKYVKKNNNNSGTGTKSASGTSFPSSSKDDEYEPYSKK
jgi:Tfp pilus assembly major pilin PilA